MACHSIHPSSITLSVFLTTLYLSRGALASPFHQIGRLCRAPDLLSFYLTDQLLFVITFSVFVELEFWMWFFEIFNVIKSVRERPNIPFSRMSRDITLLSIDSIFLGHSWSMLWDLNSSYVQSKIIMSISAPTPIVPIRSSLVIVNNVQGDWRKVRKTSE